MASATAASSAVATATAEAAAAGQASVNAAREEAATATAAADAAATAAAAVSEVNTRTVGLDKRGFISSTSRSGNSGGGGGSERPTIFTEATLARRLHVQRLKAHERRRASALATALATTKLYWLAIGAMLDDALLADQQVVTMLVAVEGWLSG